MNLLASNLSRAALASLVVHSLSLIAVGYLAFNSSPGFDIAPGALPATHVSLIEHDASYFTSPQPVDPTLENPTSDFAKLIDSQHARLAPLVPTSQSLKPDISQTALLSAQIFSTALEQSVQITIAAIQITAVRAPDSPLDAQSSNLPQTTPPAALPHSLVSANTSSIPVSSIADSGFALSPTPLSQNKPPRYPPQALRQRLTGTVLLHLVVEPDGLVSNASILDSSGVDLLDSSALDAAKRWRFQPALRNGSPIRAEVTAPINFILQ